MLCLSGAKILVCYVKLGQMGKKTTFFEKNNQRTFSTLNTPVTASKLYKLQSMQALQGPFPHLANEM